MSGTYYKVCPHISLVTMPELPCESYKINNLEVATATAKALKRMIHAQFGDIKVRLWEIDESSDWMNRDRDFLKQLEKFEWSWL